MNIPGISAYYHDARFPDQAIRFCLQAGGLRPADVDHVVYYDKPFLKFERLFETYLAFAPRGFRSFVTALPVWLKEKLFQKLVIAREFRRIWGDQEDWSGRLLFSEHHLSHAASAYFPSPFSEAAVLTMDGVGEWTTTSLAIGQGRDLKVHREIHFPHSLGLLYSAFTYHAGFRVNAGEYKLMGLAPYGEPRYVERIRDHLIDIKDDGSFALDLEYFDYCTGLRMTNQRFDALFDGPPREPESRITQREMDLAASIQAVTEEVVLKLARGIRRDTGQKNLCLAGGVALNCVANGRLLQERIFDRLWIQPAAGDAGGALGAALGAYHLLLGGPRPEPTGMDGMHGSYLGPEYTQAGIESRLRAAGAVFTTLDDEECVDWTARALAEGKAVGWHQGRMEFGPRALGSRSILADPRLATAQKTLNLKIKFRESFRPFAPSVLREHVAESFDLDADSPYMLLVAGVSSDRRLPMTPAQQELFGIDRLNVARSVIPAVTHVDYSARVQTVHKETNPRYHALIARFRELTGCPVLVNTSFNVRGEPIVCTPEDAFRCFMGTGIDVLVVGNAVLRAEEQNPGLRLSYADRHELD